jgi:beta-lactam-binding protein with PASTA domain
VAPTSASPGRRAGRRRGRVLLAAVMLLTLAVVIVATVIATTPTPTKIVLRNVVYSDVHEASSALKQLVAENTK